MKLSKASIIHFSDKIIKVMQIPEDKIDEFKEVLNNIKMRKTTIVKDS